MELAYTLQVTREGFVLIPQVGQVFVSNLTLEQLRDVLYARLGRVYSGVRRGSNATTRFDISVANVRANQVYVVGEVAQPGAYQISQPFCAWYSMTLLRFRFPTIKNSGTTLMPIAISYEIIWALERMPPRNGYFEFAA